MIKSQGIFTYSIGEKKFSVKNTIPDSWGALLADTNAGDETGLTAHPRITEVRLKVTGKHYAYGVDNNGSPTETSNFFHFYVVSNNTVTLDPVAGNIADDDHRTGEITIEQIGTKVPLGDYTVVYNENSANANGVNISGLEVTLSSTEPLDKFTINGLAIEYKLTDEEDNVTGWHLGPYSDEVVQGIEGEGFDNYLDYNDTIGEFKYVVSFVGYEASNLANRLISGVLRKHDLTEYYPKSMYLTNNATFNLDNVKGHITSVAQGVDNATYLVAYPNNAVLMASWTSDLIQYGYDFTSSFSSIVWESVEINIDSIALSGLMNAGIFFVFFEFEGRSVPVYAGNISINSSQWKSGDKIKWTFDW